MRHLNNGTDHRHSKSCCDQSSPARRTIKRVSNETYVKSYIDAFVQDRGMPIAITFSHFTPKCVYL